MASIIKYGNFTTKWGNYYKVRQVLLWSRGVLPYYKLGQGLLKSGADNLVQSGTIFSSRLYLYFALATW